MAGQAGHDDMLQGSHDVIPDLIGDLTTKQLRRHPFEGVSFFVGIFPSRKTAHFLAEVHI